MNYVRGSEVVKLEVSAREDSDYEPEHVEIVLAAFCQGDGVFFQPCVFEGVPFLVEILAAFVAPDYVRIAFTVDD